MVTFGDIIERNVSVRFTREAGLYKVEGLTNYDKDNKVTRLEGSIRKEDTPVGTFSIYTSGANTKLHMDCDLAELDGIKIIVMETYAELMASAVEV